jgi:aspartate kinase
MSVSPYPPKHLYFERETGVYDVDVTDAVAHVIAAVGPPEGRAERVVRLFRAVADAGIPVFLAKLHGQEVSFAVEAERLSDVERVLAGTGYAYRARRDLAIVTVHASTMRDLTGVMVRIADALQLAQARMYGAGDSHSSVQCLIDGHSASAALNRLKAAFKVETAGG